MGRPKGSKNKVKKAEYAVTASKPVATYTTGSKTTSISTTKPKTQYAKPMKPEITEMKLERRSKLEQAEHEVAVSMMLTNNLTKEVRNLKLVVALLATLSVILSLVVLFR